jgi:hypothetical protein
VLKELYDLKGSTYMRWVDTAVSKEGKEDSRRVSAEENWKTKQAAKAKAGSSSVNIALPAAAPMTVLKDLNWCSHHADKPSVKPQERRYSGAGGAEAIPEELPAHSASVEHRKLHLGVERASLFIAQVETFALAQLPHMAVCDLILFLNQVKIDTDWLCTHGIMDYSLLLGVGTCSGTKVRQLALPASSFA